MYTQSACASVCVRYKTHTASVVQNSTTQLWERDGGWAYVGACVRQRRRKNNPCLYGGRKNVVFDAHTVFCVLKTDDGELYRAGRDVTVYWLS